MEKHTPKFRPGLRIIKTAIAVCLSMLVVDAYGATTSKLMFAMLGALAAVQTTFKESVESCLTQIVGVILGALAGVLLRLLGLPMLISTGTGIVLVITVYNALHIRFSAGLACIIVVTICTTADISPVDYALGRIWDTAIGLTIGMLINTLVFPYDNSRRIRSTVRSLDREVIHFLEDMFDGDNLLPTDDIPTKKTDEIGSQLAIFSSQMLPFRYRRQQKQIKAFQLCQRNARQLVCHLDVLSHMNVPGALSQENFDRLIEAGAAISIPVGEPDPVTNYHVEKILQLRKQLLKALSGRA